MENKLFVAFAVIFYVLTGSENAHAQRTSVDRPFIGLSQVTTFSSTPSGGLCLEGGRYLLNSYWSVSAKVTNWNQLTDASDEHQFDHVIWGVQGGWKYRIIHSYSRMLNVYAGGKVFIGGNHYEVFKSLPPEYTGSYPECEFIYGVEPEIECEVFVSSHVAFVLAGQLPINFSTYFSSGMWNPTASLGIRINL